MRILVLDDFVIKTTKPPSWLVDPHDYTQDEIVQVLDKDRFFLLLTTQSWDEVWLDHDLGTHEYNGRTITLAIDEMVFSGFVDIDVKAWRIITMNPVAQGSMISDLVNADFSVIVSPISSLYGVERSWELFKDPEEEE